MIHIEQSTGNIYGDLGTADADAMLVKAQLAYKISLLMKASKMTQTAAGRLFQLPQPKVSALLRGQFRGISEEKMMRCLVALGQNVEISIKPAKRGLPAQLSVAI